MTYKYTMNGKPMTAEEIKEKYGAKLLDRMIRAMGYRPVDEKPKRDDKSA